MGDRFHPDLPPDIAPAELSRYWNGLLSKYFGADNRRASFQLVTTALLFVGNWAAMWYSLRGPYWITLLLALPAVGLLTRLFIFQHDCGHGSFFKSQKLGYQQYMEQFHPWDKIVRKPGRVDRFRPLSSSLYRKKNYPEGGGASRAAPASSEPAAPDARRRAPRRTPTPRGG